MRLIEPMENNNPSAVKRKVQVVVFTRRPRLQVLVLRRPPERGHIWQPVTGNVDASDSSLDEAARRELAEETGIDTFVDLTNTGHDFTFRKGPVQFVERVIGVETDGPVAVTLSSEHVEFAWLTPDDALRRIEWDTNKQGVTRVIDAVSDEQSTP